MKAKQIAKYNIGTVVVLVAAVAYTMLTGDNSLIGKLIETQLQETIAPDVSEAKQGEIISLVIKNDGDTIKSSENVKLAGGLDFTGKKGDVIVLQKQDNAWVEIGRRLVEMEAFGK